MRARILIVAGLLLCSFALMGLRVGKLTVLDGSKLAVQAQRQYVERVRTVEARGEILDRNGIVLATTIRRPSIYASPRQFPIDDAGRAALAELLGVPLAKLSKDLDKDRSFLWLARGVREETARKVAALKLPGVGELREGRRLYPQRHLAAHVIGSTDIDLKGVEGIELFYDRWMRGEELVFRVERDGRGRLLFTRGIEEGLEAPTLEGSEERDGLSTAPGATLTLSIDAALQTIVERELSLGVEKARADAGTAVMLDPWTGAILAMANVPTFDPNVRPESKDPPERQNRSVSDPFEPGSTFKAFLAAAALEEGRVELEEKIDCGRGRYRVGRWTIHDHHPYGLLSFRDVIKHSSNIGVSKVAARLGRDVFGEYVARFGFGRRTGIDLPHESIGIVRSHRRWADIDLATCSFGQGIAVTPIQLVTAFATIANGGRQVVPYLLERASTPSGGVLFERNHDAVRVAETSRVIRPETARAVMEMLESVVEERGGTGGKARVAGVSVAGKTGTAQKSDGFRYTKERLASFIGFAPARDPAFVLLVMIDNPRGVVYGGVVAAPVFAAISAQALDRLGERPAPPASPVGVLAVSAPQRPGPTSMVGSSAGKPEDVRHELTIPPADFATEPTIAPIEALPSFIGLSMRAARRRAVIEGVDLFVRGTGFVRSQDPAPGTRRGDGSVVLTLEPAI